MAIIHLSGTRLEPRQTKAPLNRQIMYLLGFVFLLAMHLFMPNLGGTSLQLPFNATTWIGFSLVFSVGFYQIARTTKIRYSKLTITLFICCCLLSMPALMPTNEQLWIAIPRLAALWFGWLLLLILQQFELSNLHKQRLLWFILLASLLESLLGYLQFFDLLPKAILGHNTFTDKPFGIFQHADVMTSFLATGLLISGYLLTRQHLLSNKKRRYGHHIGPTVLLYLTPLIQMPLIAILASKTDWYGVVLGLIMILSYLYRSSTAERYSRWLALTIVGTGLGLMLASNVHDTNSHSDRLNGQGETTQQANQSSDYRQYLFPQVMDMLIEKPFTGYGFGSFESEYVLYTARQHQLNNAYQPALSNVEHPQNETIYWGIEGGIISLIGLFLAIFLVLLKITSARQGTRLALLGLFMPIVMHSQFGSPFYQSIIHWFSFVILLFWVDQRTARYQKAPLANSTRLLAGITSVVVPLLITLYMLIALQTNHSLVTYHQLYPKQPQLLKQHEYPLPIAQKITLDWERNSIGLREGILTNNPAAIKQFIAWSLDTIKSKPRADYYRSLILAYQAIGETSKAEQIKSEAHFLFPNIDFSTLYVAPIPAVLAVKEQPKTQAAE